MKYLLIILCVLTASCSSTKRMKKLIDKVGAKEAALYISQEYPEVLEPRTIHYIDTIRDTITVTVPEYSFDTIFVNNGTEFHYSDNRIRFDVKEGKVNYTIRELQIKAPVALPVDTVIPCPPCPQKSLLDFANKKLEKAETEKDLIAKDKLIWMLLFFGLLTINLLLVAFKFRKFLGVPF